MDPVQDATEAQAAESVSVSQVEPAGEAKTVEELPKWAQRELASARSEAASYRTANKELNERLAVAKTQEELEAAVAEAAKRTEAVEAELASERARMKVWGEFPQIPADVFALLPAGDEESLRAKAAEVSAHFVSAPPVAARNRGGGLSPTEPVEQSNVREVVASIPRF